MRIVFATAFAKKNNENKNFDVDDDINVLILSSKLNRLKFKTTRSIFVNLMHNKNINEKIQTIINELFTKILHIKKNLFYREKLAIIIDDHKI